MKKLLFLLPAIAFTMVGCGGGQAKKANDGQSIETAYTIEEMIEVMADYKAGQISEVEYYVTGVFAEGTTYNSKYSSWSGYTVDHGKDAAKPFQIYSVGMDESITKNYKGNGCLDGATFVVKGYAQLYQKDESSTAVYEIAYFKNDEMTHTPQIVKVEGGKEFVEPQTINSTVANALTVIAALADSGVTYDYYAVQGVVVEVTGAYSEKYGNITFTMGDAATDTNLLTVFRASVTADLAEKIVAGARLTVTATLQKYVKDGVVTPETKDVKSVVVAE